METGNSVKIGPEIMVVIESCLNVVVSRCTNYFAKSTPTDINLYEWLTDCTYVEEVERIRDMQTKEERDRAKKTLPVVCPSGTFSHVEKESLLNHSGLIQFDLDEKDNPHFTDWQFLKRQLAKNINIAYCGLSVSGRGIWGLIPVAYPDRHEQHFDALKRLFKNRGLTIDKSCRDVSRTRGYSVDPTAYINHSAVPLAVYDEPVIELQQDFSYSSDADKDRQRVEVCIGEVLRRGTYLGESYGEWYQVGCSLANAFGESGRDYFQRVSENYTNHQHNPDKQFTACLKANSRATLGTFFYYCQRIGIEWKDLLPGVSQWQEKPQQYQDTRVSKPANRESMPRALFAWDAAKTLRFIRGAVIPDGYDEHIWPPETTI
ncbi:BT4734/BF3469 family protein [Spirosoma areae]